jgi:hypothetical protein
MRDHGNEMHLSHPQDALDMWTKREAPASKTNQSTRAQIFPELDIFAQEID